MSAYIDYKYIILLSPKLTGFKQVGNNLWNFRCPICGDSQHNKVKKRGYIYTKAANYRYHCFNCGTDKPLGAFMRIVDGTLYQEYRKEIFHERLTTHWAGTENEGTKFIVPEHHIRIKSSANKIPVSDLPKNHPAVIYLKNRNVPEKSFQKVFWTSNFPELAKSVSERYAERKFPSEGIIFEVRDLSQKGFPLMGYQLRVIGTNVPKNHRFITCVNRTDTSINVYGADFIDWDKQVFVVEGPVDSLFIPNCIASLNASLYRVGLNNAIYVNDCEPRNNEVVREIEKCIRKGYKTVLLPETYNTMDINDIINNFHYSEEELQSLLLKYTYSGATARVMFSKWKK